MQQLTVRGFDKALAREIQELARRENISLNQAALRLLRRGAGLDEAKHNPRAIGSALDDLIGTWSDGEADQFDARVADFEGIDDELWQ